MKHVNVGTLGRNKPFVLKLLVGHLLPLKNKDGTLKHVTREGSREHVLHWDSRGIHCSEPNCEINHGQMP